MDKLKPCPFCGNKDLWVGCDTWRVVRCNCGVELNRWSDTDEEAIKHWNDRVGDNNE